MKKILLSMLFVVLLATHSIASQWCQWDGSKGDNCQSDHRGYIVIDGYNVKTPSIANAAGYYNVVETYPTITTSHREPLRRIGLNIGGGVKKISSVSNQN